MLEKLTPEQDALMYVVRDEWIHNALFAQKQVVLEEVKPYIDWLYSLAGEEAPTVYVADSPAAAKKLALEKGDSSTVGWLFCGLGHSSGWVAHYDFFERIGIVNSEEFTKYKEYMKLGVWDVAICGNVAVTCNAPYKVHLDREGEEWGTRRLHNLKAPAIEWRDGFKKYYVAGVSINGDWVENPQTITPSVVLKERNVEVRKALIDIMGYERLLTEAKATLIDEDRDTSGMPRQLLEVEVGFGDKWKVLQVECPSKRDKHYLTVPPEMMTCDAATAWTFGFDDPKLHRPLVER